ncbi:MAG: YtxH domain-containing protein [Myxococcota bacterium]
MNPLYDKVKGLQKMAAALEVARALKEVSADDLLGRIGLERRRTALQEMAPWAGGFGAGLMVGGALGLLLAPMKGAELREWLQTEGKKLWEQAAGLDQHADERPGGFEASGDEGHTGPRA